MAERQQIKSKLKKCFILAVYVNWNDKNQFLLRGMNVHLEKIAVISSLSVAKLQVVKNSR